MRRAANRFATVTEMNSSTSGIASADTYLATVPRKRMAAGALCRDQAGNILLVDPNYRDTLDTPGGVVEAEESPHAACRREVAEEVGLDRPVGRVLALDWVPSQSGCEEELVIIYDGGILSSAEIDTITVPEDELDGFAFVPPDQVSARVRPVVGRRIEACLQALATGSVAALEDGKPIFSPSTGRLVDRFSTIIAPRHPEADLAI
jgi:8-oxo-dGTP diphosphatase